ncbi:putative ribonuclease H-like domain-containing protein, partial [Tanacetum coccineum]
HKGDILLVEVYVDDIIFGSTKKELCNAFEKLMHEKFQMSSMGELTFFLGLQVQQKKDGIFISQDKYVDKDGEEVDVHMYRSMIGSLMYLTSSRPDIMFSVCACARYQVNPKVSHLHAVKRIFRYLKGQPKLDLWYPKDSPFDLVAYTDSDYAGASLDKKSITGGGQFLRCRLISWQCKKQTVVANSTIEAEYVAASSCCGQAKTINGKVQLHALVDGKKIIVTESTVRRDLQLERLLKIQSLVDGKKVIVTETSVRRALHLKDAKGTDCLPTATIFAELERMGYENLTQKLTFYKAFFSPQWKFLIHTILQCLSAKTTAWNEFSSTMASAIICLATNQIFNFSKYIFDNMVKNLEGGVKFLMYPRFVQVFLDKQVEDMSKHKEIYVTPSHTKKIFANMKREGKGFSGRITPLFQTMMVQAPEEVGEGSAVPTDSHHTTTQPSTSRPQKKQSRRKQRKDSGPTEPITDEATNEEHVSTPSYDPSQSGEDRMQLNELMDLCAKLSDRVLALENTNTSQAAEIATLKERVTKLEKKRRSRTYKPRRLYKVGLSRRIASSDDAKVTLIDETQGRNDEDLMFDTGVLNGDEVFQEPMVNTATTTRVDISIRIMTLAPLELSRRLKESCTTQGILTTGCYSITTWPSIKYHRKKNYLFMIRRSSKAHASYTNSFLLHKLPQAKTKARQKMVEREWNQPLNRKGESRDLRHDEEVAEKS